MVLLYDPACATYNFPGHPERPARVLRTAGHLREQHPEWRWELPSADPGDPALLRAHTPAHLAALKNPPADSYDADCPGYPDIDAHARRGAASALRAVALAMMTGGERVFSLMRPPGHHALADRPMGFCYLNNVVVAALAARAEHGAARVAVWDFDAHHGNGTEALLHGREGFLFSSVHQLPGWPGTGERSFDNVRNHPVPPGTEPGRHLETLRESWREVVAFRPDLVLVSAGFDAYAGDPITNMTLRAEDFIELGRWLREEAPCPVACLLEGGYADELPRLVDNFLTAWEGPVSPRTAGVR